MKKILLFVILFVGIITFNAGIANAWKLIWDHPSPSDVSGYKIKYHPTNLPDELITIDVGADMFFNLDAAVVGLVVGTEYNFWVIAYDDNAESGPSNTLRWTKVTNPIIIKLLGSPLNILIKP